jgi:uncharacterized protein (DUF305 family)
MSRKLKLTVFFLGIGGFAIFVIGCGSAPTGNANTSAARTNGNSMSQGNGMNGNSMQNSHAMPMNRNQGMANMPGNGEMMTSDPDAASQPYDLQFIDSMSQHHQGAIQMAQMVLRGSENDELKGFAQKIIDEQQKEIAQLKKWRDEWYPGKPRAINMEMPGMMSSMKEMMQSGGMEKMSSAKGKELDLAFLEMMTPHHKGAVDMSRDALNKSERAELKSFANKIIKDQEAEMKQMQQWKGEWTK